MILLEVFYRVLVEFPAVLVEFPAAEYGFLVIITHLLPLVIEDSSLCAFRAYHIVP